VCGADSGYLCLSVRLSQAGTVSKRPIRSSWFFDMGAFLGLFCTLCCREVRLTSTIRVLPSAILERYVCGPDTGYLSVRPSVTSRYCVEAAGRIELEHCRSVRRSVVRTQVTCGRTNRPTTHAHCYPPAQVKLKVAHTRLASVGFRS